MRYDEERLRLTGSKSVRFRLPGFLGGLVAFVASAVLLVGLFMISVVVFVAILTVGLAVWAYLWWNTRELRKRMRERPPGGHVIEGEATREGWRDQGNSDDAPPGR